MGHVLYQLPTIPHPHDVSLNSRMGEAMKGLLAPDFSSNKGEHAGRTWSCILWLYKSQKGEEHHSDNKKKTHRPGAKYGKNRKEKKAERRQTEQNERKRELTGETERPKEEKAESRKEAKNRSFAQQQALVDSRPNRLQTNKPFSFPPCMRQLFTHGSKLKKKI